MNLCANLTLLYPELPFLERFAAAAADGFRAVEIQFPYDTPLADLQAQLQRHQLRCVLINVPAGDLMQGGEGLAAVPGREAEFRAALTQCVSYAQGLQVACVNVLPGRCLDSTRSGEYRATLQASLRLAADTLAPLGITTTFEAINTFDMPGFLISTTDDLLQMLAAVDHPALKAQFDLYHMARMQQDMLTFLQQQAACIGHIQFADAPQRGEPGTGTLDFPALFRAIGRSGYQGWVGAEYKPTGPTSGTLAWMRQLPQWLGSE